MQKSLVFVSRQGSDERPCEAGVRRARCLARSPMGHSHGLAVPCAVHASSVTQGTEVRAATQYLAIEAQFGTELIDRAAHAIDATLRGDPQVKALTIGLAAEVEAAVRHLFFQIGQGQRLMIWAVEYQALAANFHLPKRLVAAGAQGQAFEVEVVAAVSFPLQAIDLADLEATIVAFALAASKVAAEVGEQAGLAIAAELRDFPLDTGAIAIDQHEASLFLTGHENQLTIFDLNLTLQASRRRWAFRFAGIDLAGGQKRK